MEENKTMVCFFYMPAKLPEKSFQNTADKNHCHRLRYYCSKSSLQTPTRINVIVFIIIVPCHHYKPQHMLGTYCFQSRASVSFCLSWFLSFFYLLSDFSETPLSPFPFVGIWNIVKYESSVAFQYYWISYIEMQLFLEL
jgi:hypothetical protein